MDRIAKEQRKSDERDERRSRPLAPRLCRFLLRGKSLRQTSVERVGVF